LCAHYFGNLRNCQYINGCYLRTTRPPNTKIRWINSIQSNVTCHASPRHVLTRHASSLQNKFTPSQK